MSASLLIDMLAIRDGKAAASHSLLVSEQLSAAPISLLVALAEAYKRLIARLPPFSVVTLPGGGHRVGLVALARFVPLIGFASPYVAAARGGRELRYPIVGGLMTRTPGGYLAFGLAREGAQARLWVDVVGFRPRLGLGPLYILTQVQLHRLLTIAFLRWAAAAVEHAEGNPALSHSPQLSWPRRHPVV